jgi:predicted component of type VI protein secretion system
LVCMADVNKTLKDAAYVALGFGVLGFQKAQVRRRALLKTIDQTLRPVRQEFEGRLDELEERLPDQAKDLVKRARTLTKETEDQVRKLVGVA